MSERAYKDAPGTNNPASRPSRLKLAAFPRKTHGNSLRVADPIVFDDSWTPRMDLRINRILERWDTPGVVFGWFSLATDEAVTTLELSLVYMAELT